MLVAGSHPPDIKGYKNDIMWENDIAADMRMGKDNMRKPRQQFAHTYTDPAFPARQCERDTPTEYPDNREGGNHE